MKLIFFNFTVDVEMHKLLLNVEASALLWSLFSCNSLQIFEKYRSSSSLASCYFHVHYDTFELNSFVNEYLVFYSLLLLSTYTLMYYYFFEKTNSLLQVFSYENGTVCVFAMNDIISYNGNFSFHIIKYYSLILF